MLLQDVVFFRLSLDDVSVSWYYSQVIVFLQQGLLLWTMLTPINIRFTSFPGQWKQGYWHFYDTALYHDTVSDLLNCYSCGSPCTSHPMPGRAWRTWIHLPTWRRLVASLRAGPGSSFCRLLAGFDVPPRWYTGNPKAPNIGTLPGETYWVSLGSAFFC